MMYQVLTDEDVTRSISTAQTIAVIETALKAKQRGVLKAPPRFSVGTQNGSLVFTAGAETETSNVIGFRVYDLFGGETHPPHLVAVYDGRTGHLQGIIVGEMIGALRTAAINALAIRCLARPDVAVLGILGTGLQAGLHARAAAVVRTFERAVVFSPTAGHPQQFAERLQAGTGLPSVAAASAEEVVRQADVLICATNSRTPVLSAEWVKPGTHVNTIGPKFKGACELPYELARKSHFIATDSIEQVDAYQTYSTPYFLHETPERNRLVELDVLVAGKSNGRTSPSDLTLFCSVGLAGTEVVLAREVLRQFARQA